MVRGRRNGDRKMIGKFEYEEFSNIEIKNLSSMSNDSLLNIAYHATAYCRNYRDNSKNLDMPSPAFWQDLVLLIVELSDRIRWLK